jgi:hypothetical protein
MAEADEYLSELLSQERYRSLDEIERRAAMYIVDRDITEYFLSRGRKLLSERAAFWMYIIYRLLSLRKLGTGPMSRFGATL